MSKIFIQIASYRDPELLPTINSALENASNPENLIFGICWQFHPEDSFTEEQQSFLKEHSQVRLITFDVSKQASPGVCWARNQIQMLYEGETYMLQLDSHMRFADNWDALLINMWEELRNNGVNKPLITGYVPSYFPDNDPEGRLHQIWCMNFDRFGPEGWIATSPWDVTDKEILKQPIPARFYSAHFAFASGDFVAEVPHDPQFYFHGEEPSIAIRSYTHGYDLYHPNKIVCWHEYDRPTKRKQWDDDKTWPDKNNISHSRYRELLGMDGLERRDFGIYGLGNERTLEDYKRYSGIDVSNRKVQKYTKEGKFPPNPVVENYEESFLDLFKYCIDLHISEFPEKDYNYWVIAFENDDGTVLARLDADGEEVKRNITAAEGQGGWMKIWREYYGPMSDKVVVWPFSASKEWCNRKEIRLKQ